MQYKKLEEVKKLIDNKEIDSAENKLSQMQTEFIANEEYLFLRSKIIYMKKLYYLAIDTLLIALEHNEQDRTYKLLIKIYNELGNFELSNKLLDINQRTEIIKNFKKEFHLGN